MVLLSLILVPITIAYMVTLHRWKKAWTKTQDATMHPNSSTLLLSVVVAVKDEVGNIGTLVNNLKKQLSLVAKLEYIIVNDHSSDGTWPLLCQLTDNDSRFKLHQSNGKGKKLAQREGIAMASGEVIVTTDADCHHDEKWLETIARYHQLLNPDMVIAPVVMVDGKGLMGRVYELEFVALQLATAGSALSKRPLMCNGANLSFRKDLYWQADIQENYASGDDMFLMIDLEKKKSTILFLKHQDALVKTLAPKTYAAYLNQRSRWLRKATGYSHMGITMVALTMMAGNCAWLLALGLGLATHEPQYLLMGVCLFSAKYFSDYNLLKAGVPFYSSRIKHAHAFILELLYPVMILSIGMVTLLRNKKKW